MEQELIKWAFSHGITGLLLIGMIVYILKPIISQHFENNKNTREYNLKMSENVNELAKNVASTNIYFKEKLQELKNIASNTSDEVSDIKDTMLKILKIVEDLQDKS
jgi:hypothetical protein